MGRLGKGKGVEAPHLTYTDRLSAAVGAAWEKEGKRNAKARANRYAIPNPLRRIRPLQAPTHFVNRGKSEWG